MEVKQYGEKNIGFLRRALDSGSTLGVGKAFESVSYTHLGMQYGLLPCLLGKEGIGKMKVISMTPEETAVFLETGEPPASAFSTNEFDECRDFDRILYRYITRNEFDTILSSTKGYIAAGRCV